MPHATAAHPVHVWRRRVAAPPPWNVPHAFDPLVKDILATVLAVPADVLRLERGPRGKPRLARSPGQSDLRFNLSHSGEWLVVAVAVGREVGVDVQEVQPEGRSLEGIAKFCTAAETSLLAALAPPARARALAQLWAAKEALLKATGEGIGPSVRDLDLTPAADGRNVLVERPALGEAAARAWHVVPLAIGNGYAGALAVEGEDVPSVVIADWASESG